MYLFTLFYRNATLFNTVFILVMYIHTHVYFIIYLKIVLFLLYEMIHLCSLMIVIKRTIMDVALC